MRTFIFAIFFLSVIFNVHGIRKSSLYSFGLNAGDATLQKGDDISSDEIKLQTSIAFFDTKHNRIYVNTNGILSFTTDLYAFKANFILPIGYQSIAAFLADVDTTSVGEVYYREETRNQTLLDRATREIRTHFSNKQFFEAKSLFIATWDEVGYFDKQKDKTNTFQVVIVSDGTDSFVILHYVDIQWVMGAGKNSPTTQDIPAQAGFDAGDGRRVLLLPGSATAQANFIKDWSNVNIPGVWYYHVGPTSQGNVKVADSTDGQVKDGNTDSKDKVEVGNIDSVETCAREGAQNCHANARCIDYDQGYCCKCVAPWYGNGKECLERGVPQRVNGKVSGKINNITIEPTDLHTYVVTNNGRAYTAISRIPTSVGPSMQLASAIGGIVGWLFATPTQAGAQNGYRLTGGTLNRTVTITFIPGNEVLRVQQTLLGHDSLNYMRMHTYISGNVPQVDPTAKITMDEYSEEYLESTKGQFNSYARHTYRVNGTPRQYTIDQTIIYEPACRHGEESNDVINMRLKVERPYVVYNAKEQIVRYALTNQMTPQKSTDPCRESNQNCDINAVCVAAGGSSDYRCQCRQGYQGNGEYCQDIDECAEGRSDCSVNAQCLNTQGGFECRCLPGFSGDGRQCERKRSCGDQICDQNARCVFDSEQNKPICECNQEYAGDGITCKRVEFSCNEVNTCDDNADCVYDEDSNSYKCVCNDGFSGDGLSCDDEGEPEINCQKCDPNAKCQYDVSRLIFRCQCNEGYTGDGNTCTELFTESGCNIVNNCDYNAQCVFDNIAGNYRCQCNRGYRGDGITCESERPPVDTCDVLNNCDVNAKCVLTGSGYQCQCNLGYGGDGFSCRPEQCNVIDICDRNAQCVPDTAARRYVCRCNDGYSGDGRTCTQDNTGEVSCNQINNCSPNADCLYDSATFTYSCRCRSGFQGDGIVCQASNCVNNPNLCDRNAACTFSGNEYVCLCNSGFRGDGRRCIPIQDSGSYLMFAQGMSIMRVPFNPTQANPGKQVLLIPGQTAIGLDVDCYNRYFYWTDVSGKSISRARLDGSEREVLVTGLGSPEGISVDWVSQNMYWTDSVKDTIEVAKLDGTNRKTLINTGLVNPRAIVVDPSRGLMYWTDWNRVSPKIEVSGMDGTDRRVFVSEGLQLPNGLTIDYNAQNLCWGDAGTQKIECIRIDGVGRRTVYSLAEYPFGIAVSGSTIYWTNWHVKNIANIDRNGGSLNEPLSLPVGGNGRLYGISVVKNQCPGANNRCAINNGGCRWLCLPTANGGHTCACPDDVDPNECNEVLATK